VTAIAGVVASADARESREFCRSSLLAQSLYHRSPPRIESIGPATFGVALFPTLPEDTFDRQPLCNEKLLSVADVRLDNRSDLLRMLGVPASLSSEWSDSRVAFELWLRRGPRALDQLVGSFALAVFEVETATLTLARGAESDRPLCYRQTGQSVRFASMPSGVLDDRPKLDVASLASRLMYGGAPHGCTYFDGVQSVPAGHLVTFRGASVATQRFSDPASRQDLRGRDLVDAYREQLDQAVACRLRRCAGPIATHLSSGYDSSAVTATAARLRGPDDEVIAFTSAPSNTVPLAMPGDRIADESSLAGETAAMHGIRHEVVSDPRPLLDVLSGHARLFQEPVRNVLNLGWWDAIHEAAQSQGARIMLTGARGNATLHYGGLSVLASLVRARAWRDWWRQAHATRRSTEAHWRGIVYASFGHMLPRSSLDRLRRLYFHRVPLDRQFVHARWRSVANRPLDLDSWSSDERLEQIQLYLQEDFGNLTKGLLAKTGIDERDPTADPRLLQFALSLPPEKLFNGGSNRPLARLALQDRLPAAVLESARRGYQGADWWARLDPARALEIIEDFSASPTAQELIDIPGLRMAFLQWPGIDSSDALSLTLFGRNVTSALAVGAFIADVERDAGGIGVR
jgi:asparagine synthase (glutamine-hydrolysing)